MSAGFRSRVLRQLAGVAFVLAALLTMAGVPAQAIPLLQVYGESGDGSLAAFPGITDDGWLVTAAPGDIIRLWVIGNTSGPGSKGALRSANLLITFNSPGPAGTIALTGSTIGAAGTAAGYSDTGTPSSTVTTAAPSAVLPFFTDTTSGDIMCAAGSGVSGCTDTYGNHDPLKPGHVFAVAPIDDFVSPGPDSLANFNADSGTISSIVAGGVIHAYELTVPLTPNGITGWHFDVVAYCPGCNGNGQWKINPYSHDLDGTTTIPEPTTLALFGFGLVGLGLVARRRRQAH